LNKFSAKLCITAFYVAKVRKNLCVMAYGRSPAELFLNAYIPTVTESSFTVPTVIGDDIAGNTGATWTQKGSAGMSLGDMRRFIEAQRARGIQPGPIERELVDLGEWPRGATFRGI
jgi:hypothetical protein